MADQQPIYVNDDLFLGRVEEQEEFRRILPGVMNPPPGEELPYVVLLYGGGGMGKTTLARRFQQIATTEPPGESYCQTLWIDWEEERRKHAALQVGREHIRAEVVFDRIHTAAIQEGWGRHFKKYQKMCQERDKAEQEAAKALTGSGEQDELGRQLAGVGTAGLARVIRLAVPPIGDSGEALAQAFLEAGVQIGAAGAAQLRSAAETRLKARLKEQYLLFLNPEEQLALALADGLRGIAKRKPLLVFFDTYEIVDNVDIWLRELMKAAGARLLWVIAGRHDLEKSRPFGGDYFRGYRETFPRRLLAYNIPQLAQADLQAFFADAAPDRPLPEEDAAVLSQVTRGIPLAIKTAAALWRTGTPLAEIVGDLTAATPHEQIVSQMTARYLLHVVQDEDARDLYALALARGDEELLAAMMRPDDETTTFDLWNRLAVLSRRYAAVQLSQTRLHDEPAAFLEADLRKRRRSEPALTLNGRAAAALQMRLATLQTELPLLEERAEDEEWVQTALALARTLFWLDEQRAWQWLIPRFVEGLAYSRDLQRGLLEVAAGWREELDRRGKRRLKLLQAANSYWPDVEAEAEMLAELEKLARPQVGWLNGEGEAERRAVLDWRWGKLRYRQKVYHASLQLYEKAIQGLPDDGNEWQSKLADDLYTLSNVFIWPDDASPYIFPAQDSLREGLRASQLAVTLNETNGFAIYNYAVALNGIGEEEEAVAMYKKALAIEERATRYYGLGFACAALGRYEAATAAYEAAIALDPKDAAPHNALGNVYHILGRYEEATAAYEAAIALDPKLVTSQMSLAAVYRKLGNTAAYNQQIEIVRPLIAKEKNVYNRACFASICGDVEEALRLLEEAIAERSGRRQLARRDPDFEFIRDDPRFQALVSD